MKKLVKILLPIITLSFLASCSSGGGEPPKVTTYPVFFNGNGGTLIEGQELQFVHNPSEIVPPIYEKENYAFIGWDVNPTSAISITKITAMWGEEGQFVVYFFGDGGTRIGGGEEKQVVKDASEIVPPIYEKEGYEFIGWSQDISTITSTTPVVALWKGENTFIVVFDGNGGTYVSGQVTQSVSSADEIEPPTFTYPGRTFLGWDPEIDTITGPGTVIVTAQWSDPSTYTIIWQNEDGAELETDTNVSYGAIPEYNHDTPVKPNPQPGYTYEFSGWDPEVADIVTGDATYTATFKATPITYTITWTCEGKTLEIDYNVPYNTIPTYNGDDPTIAQTDTTVSIWNGGWTPEVEEATEDKTYTATFDFYDISHCTFEDNGGGTYTLAKYTGDDQTFKVTPIYNGKPVTKIGDEAFKDCTNLEEIVLPDNIYAIGSAAFSGCTSLTKINIPDVITELPAGVFINCTSLEEITIPKKVTSIGFVAFYMCSKLKEVYMLPTEPPATVSSFDTQYKNQVTFRVPKGCYNAYSSYLTYGSVAEVS